MARERSVPAQRGERTAERSRIDEDLGSNVVTGDASGSNGNGMDWWSSWVDGAGVLEKLEGGGWYDGRGLRARGTRNR